MTNLTAFKFGDLLPSSVKEAAKFKAAAACLDRLFDGFDERVKLMLIYSRIDELDNEQLDELAWQWNVGYYEGYSFAETLNDKRVLIKHAIQLHWYKGTKWALESIPIFLGMPAFTIEWFEADLIGSEMAPYEFDIAIDTGVRGASPSIHDDIHNLIDNLKNVRSYLRHIILMETWSVTAYYGAAGLGVNFGTIRPKDWEGGTATLKYGYITAGQDAWTGRVLPKPWNEKETHLGHVRLVAGLGVVRHRVGPKPWTDGTAKVKYGRATGGYAATVGRVNPPAWTGGDITVGNVQLMASGGVNSHRILPKLRRIDKRVSVSKTRFAGHYAAVTGQTRPEAWDGAEAAAEVGSRAGGYYATVGRVYPP